MRSILLIEDHEGTRDTSAVLLRSAGFHVATAADASTGLALAHAADFDVVVVDIGLPDVSGLEVVRRLVADGHPCLKIVTTAFPWDDARDQAFAAGASAFVGGLVLGDELDAILRTTCAAIDDVDSSRKDRPSGGPFGHNWTPGPAFDPRVATSIRTTAVYAADASLESMAATARLSASRFRHLFLQCTKVPVSKYLANLRLALAARLVLRSEMRLADIARMIGWWDVRYFRRLFRRRFAMSPRQYRRAFAPRTAERSNAGTQP